MDEACSLALELTGLHQEVYENEFEVKFKKDSVVVEQKFEDAANLRDTEQKLTRKLKGLQKEWHIDEASNPIKVTEENISDVVSMITRIPVRKVAESEGQKLLKMKTEMSSNIVGQDKAIESLSKAIQRSRSGLKRNEKPIGVFLFLGPTGVGKTETAKAVAITFAFSALPNKTLYE